MRKIYCFLWICCMATIVSACANDNDEPGMEIPSNNGTVGELPNEDDIWPENVRRVRRIEEIDESGLPDNLIIFLHNGKVITCEVGGLIYLAPGSSTVEICTGDGTACLELKEGRIIAGIGNINAPDYDSCYCSYENGYLKQMTTWEFVNHRDESEADDTQYDFTFNSENLSLMRIVNDEETEELKCSYAENSAIRNDANIDLCVLMCQWLRHYDDYYYIENDDDFFYLGLFGYLGERNKSLPTKIVYEKNSEYNQEKKEWNISYEVDDEGYPTRIKCEEKEGEVKIWGIYY